MKKLIFSTAAIMLAFSVNTFAGTPETKGDAKPAPEANTLTSTFTYHVTQENEDGTVEFEEGEGPNCTSGTKLCEWESSTPMTSPQTPAAIESNPNVDPLSIRRYNN